MNFYDEMNDSQTNSSDDDVIEDMNIMLEVNPIKKEKLRKISRTNTYANSVNVYVGRPRSGKTYLTHTQGSCGLRGKAPCSPRSPMQEQILLT